MKEWVGVGVCVVGWDRRGERVICGPYLPYGITAFPVDIGKTSLYNSECDTETGLRCIFTFSKTK